MRRDEILSRVIEFNADEVVGDAALYEMMYGPTKTYPLGYLASDGSAHPLDRGARVRSSAGRAPT